MKVKWPNFIRLRINYLAERINSIFATFLVRKTDLVKSLHFSKIFISLAILIGASHFSFLSASKTFDDYTGDWEESTSWDPEWINPDTTINSDNITINGYITRHGNLNFIDSDLNVEDTLIVYGNLTLADGSKIHLKSDAILIVYGNVTSSDPKQDVDLDKDAYFIITGDLKIEGGAPEGSFKSDDDPPKVFILGNIEPAELTDDDKKYPSINCTAPSIPYPNSSCSYGNDADLALDPINDFFQSLNTDPPEIIQQPVDTETCIDTAASFTLLATGVDSFQWQINSGSGYNNIIDGVEFSGATAGQLHFISPALPYNNSLFRCRIRGLDGSTIFTNEAHLEILNPAIFNIDGGGEYCEGEPGREINLSGSESDFSYQLLYNNSPLGLPVAGSGSAISFGFQTASGVYKVVANCATEMNDSAEINMFTIPFSDAGLNAEVCGAEYILAASPSVGTGSWTLLSGPGTVDFTPDTNQPDASITVSAYGTYSLSWEETNGTCSDDSTIAITFYEIPVADAGPEAEVCGTEHTLNASPSVGTGSWSVLSGPGTVNFAPDTNQPDASISVTAYGTYSLNWEETNGTCSDDSTIAITFYEIPVANAGADAEVCGEEHTLNASPSVGTGSWSILSGPGTINFAPDTNQADANITVSAYGTYNLSWQETNGTCSDDSTIAITFYEIPVADAGSNAEVCGTEHTLNASHSVGTGSWTVLSGPGTVDFTPDANQPDASITTSVYGTYSMRWEVSDGMCGDDSTISINFYEIPKANAGLDDDVCGAEYTLAATPSIGTGCWSVLSGPGTVYFTPDANQPDAAITISAYGTYSLKWQETNGTCSDDSTINLTLNEIPEINIGNDAEICGLEYQLQASQSVGLGNWIIGSGPGEVTLGSEYTNLYNMALVSEPGTYNFMWAGANAQCSDTASVTIEFNIIPEVFAGPDQVLNGISETSMNATLGEMESGEWEVLSGSAQIIDPYAPTTRITDMEIGENIIRWGVSKGSCSSESEVRIEVKNRVVPTVITPNGDSKNDYFFIEGIENSMPVQLMVFDRWGKELYLNKNYQNEWDGRDRNGNILPNGTYYYILELGSNETIKSYVLIKR